MTDLRKYARGRECQVRIPGICTRQADETVLAHFPLDAGMALKSHDLLGAHACNACHDVVDFRRRVRTFDRSQIRTMHAIGVMRTQRLLIEEGVIDVG